MKAHWLDSNTGDGIAVAELARQGIAYQRLDTAPDAYRASVDTLKTDRGYIEEDIIELFPALTIDRDTLGEALDILDDAISAG